MKEVIFNTIDDLVSDFTYYDRKEDYELTEKQLDAAIKEGIVTIDEIVDRFKNQLIEVYSDLKD